MRQGKLTCAIISALMVIITSTTLAGSRREIIVNIPEFTLYLYQDGVGIREYPIGIGNALNPSVLGETRIVNRVIHPTYYPPEWWRRGMEPIAPGPRNPVGTRWLGLGFSGYGIHGTNNPQSVGKAMSAGCIRMYNRDVEELTELVSIGTPVTLIYQTVLLTADPLSRNRLIKVFPDIYNLGTSEWESVLAALADMGWENVYQPALQAILKGASGLWTSLPEETEISLQGETKQIPALSYAREHFIPVEHLPQIDFSGAVRDDFLWEGSFVSLKSMANLFGWPSQPGKRIKRPHAYVGDQLMGPALFYQDQWWIDLSATSFDFRSLPGESVVVLDGVYGVEALFGSKEVFVPDWVIDWLSPGVSIEIK